MEMHRAAGKGKGKVAAREEAVIAVKEGRATEARIQICKIVPIMRNHPATTRVLTRGRVQAVPDIVT